MNEPCYYAHEGLPLAPLLQQRIPVPAIPPYHPVLCTGHPSGPGFPPKLMNAFLTHPMCATYSTYLIFLELIIQILSGEV
jgi:hypothetical protein